MNWSLLLTRAYVKDNLQYYSVDDAGWRVAATDNEQPLAAAMDRDTVDGFCAERGYDAGYPTVSINKGYQIACYSDLGGQTVTGEFGMFVAFADYVDGLDTEYTVVYPEQEGDIRFLGRESLKQFRLDSEFL